MGDQAEPEWVAAVKRLRIRLDKAQARGHQVELHVALDEMELLVSLAELVIKTRDKKNAQATVAGSQE